MSNWQTRDLIRSINITFEFKDEKREKIGDEIFKKKFDEFCGRLENIKKTLEFESERRRDLLLAVLGSINEELCRVMWNKNQEEYESPFLNTGNVDGYKNDVFEVHAYDWGWDYDDETERKQPINFKWKDLEITWYKWYSRGICWNREFTEHELSVMLEECLESIRKEDTF